ncbi:MAG: hypothetical protein PHG47_08700 [Sulfuricella sp.]|nr:hypothetical protein [Sulfuricella sp.]
METLTVAVGASRWLAGLLAGMHGFAAVMCWLVPLPLWFAVLLTVLLAGSAWHVLRRDGFRTLPNSLVAVRLHADGRCAFKIRGETWHQATLLGSSFVSPYLTVLNLQPEGKRFARHLVILPDAVNAADFRRLRVWLKWRN